jgi:uncharacterized protein YrrD
MVASEAVFEDRDAVMGPDAARQGQVIGVPVITDQGTEVGTVRDVVIEAGTGGRVIGFEIAADEKLDHHRRRVFVPRGQTCAVSGQAVVVPARARHFVAEDLPSFAAQVAAFRADAARRYGDTPAHRGGDLA